MELSCHNRDETSLASRVLRQVARPVLRALDRDVHQQWCNALSFDSIRMLKEHNEVKARRNQRQHPRYAKPELLASGPNQLWSWDITKLKGPAKWHYYYLYVILDLFSRYAVGWLLAEQESAHLAQLLISQSCTKQQIAPDQLTLHADRGGPMKAKTVAQLLTDLGITKSHSRPHVPDDNPYSEAHFKTLKYQPDFPGRFASFQEALTWCRRFFPWYNHQFYHSSLGLLTPASVHYGQAGFILDQRQQILSDAYATHPQRFVRGQPVPPALPTEVWINNPNNNNQVLLPTTSLHPEPNPDEVVLTAPDTVFAH